MKKGLIVLFIISTFFPCLANATYHIQYFSVQNRTYENGNQLNRLQFNVVDANNIAPSTDVLGSVVLTDPNGKEVVLTTPPRFRSVWETNSYYDANTGQYIYTPFYLYGYYATEFSDQLITGTYHLTFTDKDGQISQKNYSFNKIVDLPIIPSSSYSYYCDQDGNFILQWQLPYIDPGIQASAAAWISIYDAQENYLGELFVKVPTNLGRLVVPKENFNQVLSMGKTFTLGTRINTTDDNNRAYSTEVPMLNLAVNPAIRDVSKDAGTTTFNGCYIGTETIFGTASVTAGGSWLSITSGATSGTGVNGDGTITCAFNANTGAFTRTGTILVTATVAGATVIPMYVTVNQAGTSGVSLSPVPDTGQTKCYDVAGNVITCPSSGQALYGQDANNAINSPSYTKLDSSGNTLPDSATSWAMVKDNVTGLIWEMKTNKDGVKNYNDPHDADNLYTWYDSITATNGGYAGTSGSGTDTQDFIKALNDAHFGGYSDWRLPTLKELAYIVNYDIALPGPTINTTYFPNTQSSFYWSSTTVANYTKNAWGVFFYYGDDGYAEKQYAYYVRAVRGGQSGSFFTDNGDGTVTDSSTGLMWQKASSSNKTWEQALAYCEGLNLGAYTDWRLPTINELRSLADYSRYNPAINTTYFPDTVSSFYWSSTTTAPNSDSAWCGAFYNGCDSDDYKTNGKYVRAVRGGTPIIPPVPDIKANGQDGPITVSSGTPVSITVSLEPGDQNGKLADWWLAYSSPAGWYSLNSNGWTPGINLLTQYPLVSISPVEIYSSTFPVGDYTFYFGVDTSPNSILDLPFYYDFVQVHIVN